MNYLLLPILFSIWFSTIPNVDHGISNQAHDAIEMVHKSQDFQKEEKQSLFDFLESSEALEIHLSEDLKTIIRNFDRKAETEGTIDFITNTDKHSFSAEFDLGGKTRRKICKMPPVKINLKKKELGLQEFVEKCDRVKIVFQCNSSKSMSESIRKEKFVYDLHNLVSEYGHRAKLSKVRLGNSDKLYDGMILESDEDIEYRTNTTLLKNRTISTTVIDRDEYLKMCLFQYMISNADWSARKGHNTDLYKRNEDNSLVVIPYDFDYAGIIDNHYAIPPENLPIENVTHRYFMDKKVSLEELKRAVGFFLDIESEVYDLCDNAVYLSKGSKKGVKKFIEQFYKIIKNENRVKRMIN